MERRFLLPVSVLFLVLTQTTSTAVTAAGSGNGGCPQDPEEETLRPEAECRIPPYADPARIVHGPPNFVEDESNLIESRCYLACVNEVKVINKTELGPHWEYVVGRNCAQLRMIHECIRGCVLANQVPPHSGECWKQCQSSCIRECGDDERCDVNPDQHDPWFSTEKCSHFNCGKKPCQSGCAVEINIPDGAVERPPPDPIGPPRLTLDRGVGQYSIDLSGAAPRPREGEVVNRTSMNVIFLLRFEEAMSHNVSYMWVTNPSQQVLDHTDYACQELLVSFAVINRAGLSNFSAPQMIFVEGDDRRIPAPPVNLQELTEIDTRRGFFGHVILNITWDRPQSIAYLDNFTVIVSPATGVDSRCGSEPWIVTVPPCETSVRIVAESEDSLPVMDCTYSTTIYATGLDGNSEPLTTSLLMPKFDPGCIKFHCKRLWQVPQYLFWFQLNWTLPSYLLNWNDTSYLRGFNVHARMKDSSFGIIDAMSSPLISVPLQQNIPMIFTLQPRHTSNPSYHLPQHETTRLYYFEASPDWNYDNLPFRPDNNLKYECNASVISPPPSPVNNFTVVSYELQQSRIILDLEWYPPAFPNGNLVPYNICVGGESLGPNEEVGQNTGHFCAELSVQQRLPHDTTIAFFFVSNNCLYIQIRANNQYVSGNWSQSYIIDLHPSGQSETIPATGPASPTTCAYSTTSSSVLTTNPSLTTASNSANLTSVTDKDSGSPSNTTAGFTSSSQASTSTGATVGALLGCLVVLALLSCSVFLTVMYMVMVIRRKRLLRITQEPCDDPMFSSGPRKLLLHRPIQSPLTSPLKDEWEIPPNEVIIEDCLGEGAFGEVYKGIIKCPIINPKVRSSVKNAFCTPVAIKLLKLSAKGNERQDFLSEIEMMKKVAEGLNPHVVSLVGCVTIQEPLCLITEFIRYGDLLSYLKTNRRMYTGSNLGEESSSDAYNELGDVSPMDLISFAYQIASGMEYLSSLGIVHRDLACRNILVDEGKVLKITDFGMSRETDEIYVQKRTGRVPLKWMAIESIIAREFTSASDVWSYGIVLWEIGTLGGFPYPSVQNEDLLSLLKRGYRMEKPDNCSTEVYDVMLMCWNEEPQKRPKFTELRSRFDAMLLAERKDAYIDLRIDNDKPYYRLDTMATITTNGLHLSPNPSRHSFVISPSLAPTAGNKPTTSSSSKEPSPRPMLHTPNLSPGHMLQASNSCCSSTQASPRKSEVIGCNGSPSSSPFTCSPCHDSICGEQNLSTSDADVSGRDHNNVVIREGSRGRPVSLLLPSRDRADSRERRERQNPYVDEPSRAAAAMALILPNGDGSDGVDGRHSTRIRGPHARRGSDGAIELNQLRSRSENGESGIQITITGD